MIHIYHGDNQNQSRASFNSHLDSQSDANLLRVDAKDFNIDHVLIFLTATTLIGGQKVLAFTNFFSIPKPSLDKLTPHIIASDSVDVIIWQDKKLTAAQLKFFPKSTANHFPLNKSMFACLNSLKPNNSKQFLKLLNITLKQEPYDLFLYLLKNSLRKQLTSRSSLDHKRLKQAYLNLIDLDHLNKTGQLTTPKEVALERIIIRLLD